MDARETARDKSIAMNGGSADAPLIALAASASMLGWTLQISDGFYAASALGGLVIALALAAIAVWRLPPAASVRASSRLRFTLLVGIAINLAATLGRSPAMYLDAGVDLRWFRAGILAEAVIVASGAWGSGRLARAWFPALLATNAALGVWVLVASPRPAIDVVEVHHAALRALGRGHDPYAITFRNIYDSSSAFYNPKLVASDRVLFGYPYPPLSLFLAAPGQVVLRDYRFAALAALCGVAGFMAWGARSPITTLTAALFLTSPRNFLVLEQGWTEPFGALVLAWTVFCLRRHQRGWAWAAGLVLGVKQYFVLGLPLLWRAAGREGDARWRELGQMAAAAVLPTLPFLLWNPRAFVESAVLLQVNEPFRQDSLSVVSWAARMGWGEASVVWAVGAAVAALAWVIWRTRPDAAGLAGGLGLVLLVAFAFGSKAFCNYYFLVIGALCCAIAACAADVADGKATSEREQIPRGRAAKISAAASPRREVLQMTSADC